MTLTITCPICGKRNGYEFRYGGEELGPRPDDQALTRETWCDYVHMRAHRAGPRKEWWFHRDGCHTWFLIWRDTRTNRQIDEPETP